MYQHAGKFQSIMVVIIKVRHRLNKIPIKCFTHCFQNMSIKKIIVFCDSGAFISGFFCFVFFGGEGGEGWLEAGGVIRIPVTNPEYAVF